MPRGIFPPGLLTSFLRKGAYMRVDRYKAVERLAMMRINKVLRDLDQWRADKQAERRMFCFRVHTVIKTGLRVAAVGLFLILASVMASGSAHAADVVKIAQSQIGKGEIGGDNRGPIVRQYTKGKEVAWCAGFVSWTLSRAGIDIPYYLAAKSYLGFRRVATPRAGDIIVLRRTGGSHVGIVENVRGGVITTIQGNVGPYPARVKRVTYTLGHIKNLIGFVRV